MKYKLLKPGDCFDSKRGDEYCQKNGLRRLRWQAVFYTGHVSDYYSCLFRRPVKKLKIG